jgi:hypothetical protein
MAITEEVNIEQDFSIEDKPLVEIFFDFISALDEAIATYKVLNHIAEEIKANQLLFSHIVNSFDSFVNRLLEHIILSNEKNLEKYFSQTRNLEDKLTLKEIIVIQKKGVIEWMKGNSRTYLENDLRRKRHAQKLELLMENADIDYKNIFVHLSGGKLYEVGNLKSRQTPKKSWSVNHKTATEKLIGYADILYEKRNAITHNRSDYPQKTIERLNQEWDLKINRKLVLIRRSTIRSLSRFYTSVGLLLLKSEKVAQQLEEKIEEFTTYLSDLNKGENIRVISTFSGIDFRSVGGGLKGRKEAFLASGNKTITIKQYAQIHSISSATAIRDFKILVEEGVLKKIKGTKYKLMSV